MTHLIVTADDFGISKGISLGILRAHHEGVVTAVSAMANGQWIEPAARTIQDAPRLAVGAHVAFVGEDRPLLSHREAPTLINKQERLPATWRQLSAAVLAHRVNPADLHAEGQAQITHLHHTLGMRLSHINTHQHVHLLPAVAQVVVGLAAQANIPYVRVPSTTRRTPQGWVIRRWRANLTRMAATADLTFNDAFAGLDGAGNLTQEQFVAGLTTGPKPHVLEINCHPGLPDRADRDRYRWGYAWEAELAMLTDPALEQAITTSGARLCTPPPGPHPDRTSEEVPRP